MSRLDDYRTALLVADSSVPSSKLDEVFESRSADFAKFVIDYGLGPIWHERTSRIEFRESRFTAEARFLLQQNAIKEIDGTLSRAGIEYVLFKGAANRQLVYDNPAIRACHDVDILVRDSDRLSAASALISRGFSAILDPIGIGRGIILRRHDIDIDLHWGLLRAGRLRHEFVEDVLADRRRVTDCWVPCAEDTLFFLLVHPAFAKHLSAYGMGLHRVLDIVLWLERQSVDWAKIINRLSATGVRTAAWATLTWMQLLIPATKTPLLTDIPGELEPGPTRRRLLGAWLRNDLHSRLENLHWVRLLAFSTLLHDSISDLFRAAGGRFRDAWRAEMDLKKFERLVGQ